MVSPSAAVFLERRLGLRPIGPGRGGSARGYTLCRVEQPGRSLDGRGTRAL